MKDRKKTDKRTMGVVVLAVFGIFAALHMVLPETKLWPAGLISIAVATMLVAHFQKARHNRDQINAQSAEQIN